MGVKYLFKTVVDWLRQFLPPVLEKLNEARKAVEAMVNEAVGYVEQATEEVLSTINNLVEDVR